MTESLSATNPVAITAASHLAEKELHSAGSHSDQSERKNHEHLIGVIDNTFGGLAHDHCQSQSPDVESEAGVVAQPVMSLRQPKTQSLRHDEREDEQREDLAEDYEEGVNELKATRLGVDKGENEGYIYSRHDIVHEGKRDERLGRASKFMSDDSGGRCRGADEADHGPLRQDGRQRSEGDIG